MCSVKLWLWWDIWCIYIYSIGNSGTYVLSQMTSPPSLPILFDSDNIWKQLLCDLENILTAEIANLSDPLLNSCNSVAFTGLAKQGGFGNPGLKIHFPCMHSLSSWSKPKCRVSSVQSHLAYYHEKGQLIRVQRSFILLKLQMQIANVQAAYIIIT